jgi:DNA-binding LytR/AlgR family response regulator
MIKCYLVEDEAPAMKVLENFTMKIPGLEIAGKFSKPQEALEALKNKPVHLLFLDIMMPGMNGIELLKSLEQKPVTILTTANHDFALEAFGLDVVDYITKPFSFERFHRAVVDKALPVGREKFKEVGEAKKPEYIMLKSDYKHVKVMHNEILFIEGLGEYVKIILKEKLIVTLEALKNLEQILPEDTFMRIHKSFIVNKNFIRSLNGHEVNLHSGAKLPVGKIYREAVKKLYG